MHAGMNGVRNFIWSKLWWVLPLILFDFSYYYFVQYMVERRTENMLIEIHGEALFFLFMISLLSIACVWLSDLLLERLRVTNLPVKYLLSIILSFIIFLTIAIGVQYMFEYSNGPKPISYLINHSIIFLFLHLIVGNATIAVSYFNNARKLSEKLLVLEKAKTEKDLKILQQQMSPHFLFNNLNTLTSLIPSAPDKAILFTRKLSSIFRHATDYANKELIPLTIEVQFLKDYMELLSFRFGSSYLMNDQTSPESLANYLSVPLALQVVIENVLKHNAGSKDDPMVITMRQEADFLMVENEVRPKLQAESNREGVGLKNLNQQYELITGRVLIIANTNGRYSVKIPLIKQLYDEDIDH